MKRLLRLLSAQPPHFFVPEPHARFSPCGGFVQLLDEFSPGGTGAPQSNCFARCPRTFLALPSLSGVLPRDPFGFFPDFNLAGDFFPSGPLPGRGPFPRQRTLFFFPPYNIACFLLFSIFGIAFQTRDCRVFRHPPALSLPPVTRLDFVSFFPPNQQAPAPFFLFIFVFGKPFFLLRFPFPVVIPLIPTPLLFFPLLPRPVLVGHLVVPRPLFSFSVFFFPSRTPPECLFFRFELSFFFFICKAWSPPHKNLRFPSTTDSFFPVYLFQICHALFTPTLLFVCPLSPPPGHSLLYVVWKSFQYWGRMVPGPLLTFAPR